MHTQSEPEQISVGYINLSFVRGSNPRHVAEKFNSHCTNRAIDLYRVIGSIVGLNNRHMDGQWINNGQTHITCAFYDL